MIVEPLEGKALIATQLPKGCTMVGYDGAVRSSKTVASLLAWVRFVLTGPQGALLLSGRTETAVINNVVLPLQAMLGTKRVVLNRGLGIVNILGREHRIIGANDVQARTKIQGMTLAGAYVDEAANVHEDFFDMLRSRLSVPGAFLIFTCNPEGPKHWLLVKWLSRAGQWIDKHGERRLNYDDDSLPELYRVTFVLSDNHWLVRNNPKFYNELLNTWPKNSPWHRRYIESEWVSADGMIYQSWDETRMAISSQQVPAGTIPLMVGVDYGTNHRTRGYLIGMTQVVLGKDGHPDWEASRGGVQTGYWVLIVLREFSPDTATIGQHAQQLEDWLTAGQILYGFSEWVAVDPAALAFRAELFNRGRSDVMNAHNAVLPGIQTVDALMAANRLYVVSDQCPYLVDMVDAYAWDTKATERGQTKPKKEDDDEVDALRYAIYTSAQYWRQQIPLAPVTFGQMELEQQAEAA